jgi:hypothetical protein
MLTRGGERESESLERAQEKDKTRERREDLKP